MLQHRIKYLVFLAISIISIYAILTINCQSHTAPQGNRWGDAIGLIYLGFACSGNVIKFSAVGVFMVLGGVMLYKIGKSYWRYSGFNHKNHHNRNRFIFLSLTIGPIALVFLSHIVLIEFDFLLLPFLRVTAYIFRNTLIC